MTKDIVIEMPAALTFYDNLATERRALSSNWQGRKLVLVNLLYETCLYLKNICCRVASLFFQTVLSIGWCFWVLLTLGRSSYFRRHFVDSSAAAFGLLAGIFKDTLFWGGTVGSSILGVANPKIAFSFMHRIAETEKSIEERQKHYVDLLAGQIVAKVLLADFLGGTRFFHA